MKFDDETTSLGELHASPDRSSHVHGDLALTLILAGRVQEIPLVDGCSIVVGRSDELADVSLTDNRLSRRHAVFTMTGGEVWVEDLQSTNGTWLRGERIRRARLDPGDRLLFGDTVAILHRGDRSLSELSGPGRLSSHEYFCTRLEEALKRAREERGRLALLMIQGLAGNEIASVAPARGAPGEALTLGRYSGDILEVFSSVTLPADGAALASRLLASGSETRALCGGALFPDSATSAEALIAAAIQALRSAGGAAAVRWAPPAAGLSSLEPAEATQASVVESPAMAAVNKALVQIASSSIPVLIVGETGVGKEVIARRIHRSGPRRDKPMVCINCAAIPGSLIESTLFGHERGAYTGADRQAKGVFEEADGGTLLLDEVGELPLTAQAALLRVVESQRINRVGSVKEFGVDVRLIAATHRNLRELCRTGAFRDDLFYRLNMMTIRVPPLRERVEEIASLAATFIHQANQTHVCRVAGIHPDAMSYLRGYAWPGNVRELRNVIERAVVLARSGIIDVEHLSRRLITGDSENIANLETPPLPRLDPGRGPEPGRLGFKERVRQYERALIAQGLISCAGNKSAVARLLGIPIRTLTEKMKAYDLPGTEAGDGAEVAARVQHLEALARLDGAGNRRAGPVPFKQRVQVYERALISQALATAAGNKTMAARLLDMPLSTLKEKLAAYGLQPAGH